jgi:hypothetical protein
MNKILKKELSSKILFLLAIFSYITSYFLGGIYGEALGVLGFMLLSFAIIKLIRELSNKKKINTTKNKDSKEDTNIVNKNIESKKLSFPKIKSNNYLLPISIVLGCIILGSFYYASRMNYKNTGTESYKEDEYLFQLEERCYFYEDKKCVTKEEKEVIKLIPENAILREIKPLPLFDKSIYIGIYIEGPEVQKVSTNNMSYSSCGESVRGQGIQGIYHLFTYGYGKIESDIVIPKSITWDDYNPDLAVNKISMAWKNTKYNNFNHFKGGAYSQENKYDLEITDLINFQDLNGDGQRYEFILFGGMYMDCSTDENLIAGFDKENNVAIIYKLKSSEGQFYYWGVNFFPDESGSVIIQWPCGDHGSMEERTIYYKYDSASKYYYFFNKTIKDCY